MRGWLPVGREALEDAIARVAGRRAEDNLRAFLLGRVLAGGDGRPAGAEDADALIERVILLDMHAEQRGERPRLALGPQRVGVVLHP